MAEKTMPEGKRLSLEQEERIARMFSGNRTPRSGGGGFAKGDVLSDDWFVECKTTVKPSDSYSVRKDILDKMDHERAEMHKPYATLAFTLGEAREDYFAVNRRVMAAVLDQQSGIKDLITEVQESIQQLDAARAEQLHRAPDNSVSKASYEAHRAEKLAILERLERLV